MAQALALALLCIGCISSQALDRVPAGDLHCPSGVIVRKEIRDMTAAEWANFKAALMLMYRPREDGFSAVDGMTRTHLGHAHSAHDGPQFLPWHRAFLLEFEKELRSINMNLSVPYWDWTIDAESPLQSPIFAPEFLGIQNRTTGDCTYPLMLPKYHCLKRDYDAKSFSKFYDKRAVEGIVKRGLEKGYSEFRLLLEEAPHGIVHVSIGGKSGDMAEYYSPNDPIFWVHHAFVDKVWADYQMLSAEAGRVSSRFRYGGSHAGRLANEKDVLHPFGRAVKDYLDSDSLCYVYQPSSKHAYQADYLWNKKLSAISHSTRTPSQSVAPTSLHAQTIALEELPTTTMDVPTGPAEIPSPKGVPSTRLQTAAPLTSTKDSSAAPSPLPEKWISMHGFDEKAVREHEETLREFMDDKESVSESSVLDPRPSAGLFLLLVATLLF